jgi:hypothetical protein
MKNLTITKGQLVNVPTKFQKSEGCVAFQTIKVSYFFYGAEQTDVLDTKILKDGSQFVITGNGFIKDGFKIN